MSYNTNTPMSTGSPSSAAIYTATLASGRSVWIGVAIYVVNGYAGSLATANQGLHGTGNDCVIFDHSEAVVAVGADNVAISDVQLEGDIVTSVNNHGINGAGFDHTRISNVLITRVGGHGVLFTPNVDPNQGPQIDTVRVYGAAGSALRLDGMEYATVTNFVANGCGLGAYIDGGNNQLVGSALTACGTGLYINSLTDVNDGHMVIVANSFNHSTGAESVHIEPLAKGLGLLGNNIYGFGAAIFVKGDAGAGKKSLVRFVRNEISVNDLNFDGALVEFDGNLFSNDAGSTNTFNTAVSGHPSTIIVRPNNMALDGTPFDTGLNPQWDVPGTRDMYMRWAGAANRSGWRGTHGAGFFGDGNADAQASIGPLVGAEAAFSAVWCLAPSGGVDARTGTNWMVAGDGIATAIFQAPATGAVDGIPARVRGAAGTATDGPVQIETPLNAGFLSFALGAGANVLTQAQSDANVVILTGAFSAGTTLQFQRHINNTSLAFIRNNSNTTCTVSYLSGGSIAILANTAQLIVSDGVNLQTLGTMT